METIECTGETIEEAIQKGLEELGVTASDVMVTVLEEPSRGLFGLGSREARVRLQLIGARPARPAPPAPSVTETPPTPVADDTLTDDDARIGKEVLAELLERMRIKADITVQRTEPSQQGEAAPWLLNVQGRHVSNLIGRRGETLASLQYITRLMASRRLQRRANIIVDVDGYKSRRSDRLVQLALRMAEQAVKQGRTISLEPMPPNERRIIHLTLRNRPDVTTRSVGEGSSRKVTIVPK